MLAVEADNAEIITVEGLGLNQLSPLQQAFLDHGAVQCGFCIPGVLMAAQAILNEGLQPNEQKICAGLSGNLCRCGGYNRFIKAICSAAGGNQRTEARKTGGNWPLKWGSASD